MGSIVALEPRASLRAIAGPDLPAFIGRLPRLIPCLFTEQTQTRPEYRYRATFLI
jgi:hypothetical protein